MPPERRVLLHIYDCTTTSSGQPSSAIAYLNALTRELWLGGIFHGALELEQTGREWSFGYCPQGSGVYDCAAKLNPLYKYRESILLGSTRHCLPQVSLIIYKLRHLWQGSSYDLLTRNCCHFCEEFALQLGVSRLPGWLNRFANAADSALSWTQSVHQQIWGMRCFTQNLLACLGSTNIQAVQAATMQASREPRSPRLKQRHGWISSLPAGSASLRLQSTSISTSADDAAVVNEPG